MVQAVRFIQSRSVIGVYGLYLLLALLFSGMVLVQGNTVVIGEQYQGALPLWLTWYPLHAFSNNTDIAFNNFAIYPIETNWIGGVSLLSSLFYLPLRWLTGPVLGFHLLLPLYLTLNAAFTFIFLRKYTLDSIIIPLVGGLVMAFNPITWGVAVQGQLSLVAFFPLIWGLLAWDHLLKAPSLKRGVWAALFVYLAVLMSMQLWNILLTIWLPYAIYTGWQSTKRETLIDPVLWGIVIFGLCFAIFPSAQLLWSTYAEMYTPFEIWQGRFRLPESQWINITRFTVLMTLLSVMVPWRMNPDRRLWFPLVFANIFFFHEAQYAPLHLVNRLLEVPHISDLTRTPIFLPAAFFAAVVSFTVALYHYRERLPYYQVGVAMIGVVLVIASGWRFTLPITDLPDMNRYAFMRDEPEAYGVIDFPMGVDSLAYEYSGESQRAREGYTQYGFAERAGVSMLYPVWYGKRAFGGISEAVKQDQLELYSDHPLARIGGFQFVDEDTISAARKLRQDVTRWRVAYVTVSDRNLVPTSSLNQWLNWTATFCLTEADDQIEIWRAAWHPAGCPATQIDIGSEGDEYAVGQGWFSREDWGGFNVRWAGGSEATQLILWATPATDYTLQIRASSPVVENQQLEILANGEPLDTLMLTADWDDYSVMLPRTLIEQDGFLELELRHTATQATDGRLLAAVYDRISIAAAE